MSVGHPDNHVGTHDRHVACDVVDSDYDATASAPDASTSSSMLGSRCGAAASALRLHRLAAWVVDETHDLGWMPGVRRISRQ